MARRVPARSAAERLERSARFWMRAYPRRWRAAFGDDFVGVLADLADPGTVRVPAREAVAVVKGGWALRLREHPPLLRWLGYRLLEVRLPLRYQHWVADDLLGSFWFTRAMAASAMLALAGVLALFWAFSDMDLADVFVSSATTLGGSVVLSVLLGGLGSVPRRRKAWQRHISTEVPLRLLPRADRQRARLDERGA